MGIRMAFFSFFSKVSSTPILSRLFLPMGCLAAATDAPPGHRSTVPCEAASRILTSVTGTWQPICSLSICTCEAGLSVTCIEGTNAAGGWSTSQIIVSLDVHVLPPIADGVGPAWVVCACLLQEAPVSVTASTPSKLGTIEQGTGVHDPAERSWD